MIKSAEGRLMLLRHSQTKGHGQVRVHGGRSNIGLSQDGLRAADKSAIEIAKYPIVEVWSSPRTRAVQTAQPIATRLGLEVKTNPLLIERDFGTFEDPTLTEKESKDARAIMVQNWHRRPTTRLVEQTNPQYETDLALLTRASVFINSLDSTKPDDITLIVGHWDWISNLLLHQTGQFLAPSNNASVLINREDFSLVEMQGFELRRTHV